MKISFDHGATTLITRLVLVAAIVVLAICNQGGWAIFFGIGLLLTL